MRHARPVPAIAMGIFLGAAAMGSRGAAERCQRRIEYPVPGIHGILGILGIL